MPKVGGHGSKWPVHGENRCYKRSKVNDHVTTRETHKRETGRSLKKDGLKEKVDGPDY